MTPSRPRLTAISNLLWDVYSSSPRDAFFDSNGNPIRSADLDGPEFDRFYRAVCAAGPMYESIGACPTNVAIGFASLGGHVYVIGPLTKSDHGERVVEELHGFGMECIRTEPEPICDGICICSPEPGGERNFAVRFPRFADDTQIRIPDALQMQGDFLVVSVYELYDPVFRGFTIDALRIAAMAGTPIVFDCGESGFVERHAEKVWEIVRLGLEVIVIDDASRLVLFESKHAPSNPSAELSSSVRHIITTRGTHGAQLTSGGETARFPAKDVNVVDTTGAGDALLAGFLWGLAEDRGADRSMRFGLAAAAEVVRTLGPHLPSKKWKEILRAF